MNDPWKRPDWHDDAACRGMCPDLWFPARGEDPRPAKAVCATCPVIERCAEAGWAEYFGVWGGLSERARKRARHSARRAAA